MGLIFFYGLTTQVPAVAWVAVAGIVLVYALGVIVRRVAPGHGPAGGPQRRGR